MVDFRTKSAQIAQRLKEGESAYLVHRSTVIAEIIPVKEEKKRFQNAKPFDPVRYEKMLSRLKKPIPHMTYEERDRVYREAMEAKHGKPIS